MNTNAICCKFMFFYMCTFYDNSNIKIQTKRIFCVIGFVVQLSLMSLLLACLARTFRHVGGCNSIWLPLTNSIPPVLPGR